MKYTTVLSTLLISLTTADPVVGNNRATYLHQRAAVNNHLHDPATEGRTLASEIVALGSPELRGEIRALQSQSQILRRSAMEVQGQRSNPIDRPLSAGSRSHSSRNSSPLRISPSLHSSSGSESRSSSSSRLSSTSSTSSWDRPPRDYNEAFRRLGVAPPQPPSMSRLGVQAQQQQGSSQNGQVNGSHNGMSQQRGASAPK